MNHQNIRYYIMLAVAICISLTAAFLANTERSPISIIFTAIMLGLPLVFLFLFVDFTLTITNKYKFMKYFYLLVVATVITQVASQYYEISVVSIISSLFLIVLGIAIVSIIVLFSSYALRAGQEGLQSNTPHAMHKLADAYQKQKDNPQSWEEQFYDFFAEKFQGYTGKKNVGEQEKVNV